MRKKVSIIILIITALMLTAAVIAISHGKGFMARSFLERSIKGTMGLRFAMEDCIVSLLNSDVRIKDLVILNPKEFQDKIMLDISEIYADFDTASLLKRKPYLKDLRINIDEISIIKNREGILNLERLIVVKASQQGKMARDIAEAPAPEIPIDSFELKIRKVVYKDYTQALAPLVIEKELNINERFENIQNPAAIVRLILIEAIKKAALEQFLSINLNALSKPVEGILNAAKSVGKGAATVLQQAGKQITEAVKTMAEAGKKPEQTEGADIDSPSQNSN